MELEMLKTIIEKTLGRNMDAITEKTTFVDDLGVDSLDFFQILIDLEETFDVRIAPEEAEEIVTVGDAVETLRRVTKGRRNGKKFKKAGADYRIPVYRKIFTGAGNDTQLLCQRKTPWKAWMQ